MKVGDKGSPFQQLSAGSIESNQKPKAEAAKEVSGKGITEAAEKNKEAAATISRVAVATRAKEQQSEEGREVEVRNRKEVEESVRAASELKVEDVDRFTQMVAERISKEPETAKKAHNPAADKVQQLLQ